MSPVRVALFGAPRLERNAKPIEISTRKAIALLAFLVLTPRRHSRESLAALLWSEYDHTHARGALRNTLYELNRVLCRASLDLTRDDVAFVEHPEVTIDVVEFHRHINACGLHGHAPEVICRACLEELAQAAALCCDDFLAGFNIGAGPEFEEWQRLQTETLRHELASVLERLSRGYRDRGNFASALEYACSWQSLDSFDEVAARRVMELYGLSGHRAAALQSYQELVERLERELGASPQTETTELYKAIRTNQFLSAPPQPGFGNLAAHLPTTPFIGREEELARLAQWLDKDDARLLTIVGPGGMGKTRLAIHGALVHGARFSHGAYFVPLAAVGPELLVAAFAQALNFGFQGSQDAKTQLLNFLRDKNLLLVLDNFEHLKNQFALLREILTHAPCVKLLVTSREWLNVREEQVLDLGGLPYPETNRSVEMKLEDYGAVQLFVQNARRVHWSFGLEREARGVERICQLVEGMPLGIELASAWVRVLASEEIAQEIERDLGILATTLGGIPERHRNLRVVFDYSYNRLDSEAQCVFRKVSLFRGGFTREAAERVAGASLQTLATLVNHSLLHRTPAGRYEIHELVRQYGEDKLRQSECETNATLDAHGAYYAAFLQAREADLKGKGQLAALQAIAQEMDNVRAMWKWAVAQGRVAEIAQSFESQFLFLRIRSHFKEGAYAFERAAQVLESSSHPILLAQILARQASFLELLGQFEQARAVTEKSLAKLPENSLETRRTRAFALTELGAIAFRQGELVEAHKYLQEGLALHRAEQNVHGTADTLRWLGQIASALDGDHQASERMYRESLALYRRVGDPRGIAASLNTLSNAVGDLGEYDEARRLLQESVAAYQVLGDRYGVAMALNNLGVTARSQGKFHEAWQCFQESLVLRREVGDRFAIALVLANLGKTAIYLREYDEAQHLLEESLDMHRQVGDQLGIAGVLNKLGILATRTRKQSEAKNYFTEALRIALERNSTTTTMEILSEFAALLANGDGVRAAELAAFVLNSPTADRATKDNVACWLTDLATWLPPDMIMAARAKAHARKLEQVTKEILALAE
ncbi:MAG: tetratricopeptide repeat protein [Chloroflexi bacterium]|nr:tetratricopeptide repeat protein [Chloroflexota bacterium]